MTYRHPVRIRYGECDMQKVVFNANYLAYIDDATDTWFRQALGAVRGAGFDFMVKKVAIEWQSAARFGRCSSSTSPSRVGGRHPSTSG